MQTVRIEDNTPLTPSMERALGPEAAEQSPEISSFAEIAALCPIGALDSGMGGLSIVAELRRTLPNEDIIFYGDNANCPYGGRSDEWLRARVLEVADFLLEQGAKALVVACNTASAAGLDHLRARHSLPIIGLVPAVKPAVMATHTRTVGVLATKATMRGRLLRDVIERFADPEGVEVVTVAPDGLVEAVERGDLNTPETAEAVSRAIAPMLERGADAMVLGCTHYPFLKPLIIELTGGKVQIIDSNEGVARHTANVLRARHLLHPPGKPGTLTVYTSADAAEARPLVWRLVGEEVEVITNSARRAA
ncbi:MAG: glutamate racemase [Chloroflexota bacterium]